MHWFVSINEQSCALAKNNLLTDLWKEINTEIGRQSLKSVSLSVFRIGYAVDISIVFEEFLC